MLGVAGRARQGARGRAEPGAADVDAALGPRAPRRRQPRPGSRRRATSTRTSCAWGRWRGTAGSSTTRRRTTRCRCCARRCGTSRTRRSATGARPSAAWCTPTRPPRCRPCCCLLDGSVTLRSVDGSREVAAAAFFTGPMESAVRPGELAVSATFRRPPAGSGSAFVEVARRQGDYAVCGVGAVVSGARHRAGWRWSAWATARCWSTCPPRTTDPALDPASRATSSTTRSSRRATSTPAPTTVATSRTCWWRGRVREARAEVGAA